MMDFTSLVIITVLVTVGGSEAKRVTTGKPPDLSPVLGGFLLGLILFLLGIASEEITKDLCYLIIVSSLIINGTAVGTALNAKKKG
jgi:hypothetical protein